MKIEGGRSVSPSATGRKAGAAAAPGFAPATEEPQRAAAAAPVNAVASLDMIMALQAEGEGGGQRRARQARRGRDALDALEKLVRGLVLGTAPGGLVNELQHLRRGAEETGDSGLDAVLTEIDIRLEVELAKLEMAAGRA